jgi:site-specific DNA-methyltransferase (adenine-specific)
MKRLVFLWSDESDIILDPFCGSGTTCVAAKEMGRKFIGIEISPEYAAIAQRRVDSVGHQLEVF